MWAQNEWVPARWRAGLDPARLRSGPVNCLVVDWPATGEDTVRRLRAAGFAVVGDLGSAPGTPHAAEGTRATGLDALMGAPGSAGDSLVPAAPVSSLPRTGPWQIAVVREGVWPGVRAGAHGASDAGPTGAPWIDSNGWAARLARALAPGKTIWLDFAPPAGAAPSPDNWLLALCDAQAHGARWILPAAALDTPAWAVLSAALAFFQAHRGWPSEAVSSVGTISAFSGAGEFLAQEFLNLSARRQLPVRILPADRAISALWYGLETLVYPDQAPPPPALLARMLATVEAGALLVAPPALAPLLHGRDAGEPPCPGYRMLAIGKGRAAVALQPWDDPFLLAADVQNLAGRRNAPVRLWNPGATMVFPTGETPARTRLVHLVKYASRGGDPLTLGLTGRYRAAALYTPGAAPVRLAPQAVRRGVEFPLPRFGVYGAVLLEG